MNLFKTKEKQPEVSNMEEQTETKQDKPNTVTITVDGDLKDKLEEVRKILAIPTNAIVKMGALEFCRNYLKQNKGQA